MWFIRVFKYFTYNSSTKIRFRPNLACMFSYDQHWSRLQSIQKHGVESQYLNLLARNAWVGGSGLSNTCWSAQQIASSTSTGCIVCWSASRKSWVSTWSPRRNNQSQPGRSWLHVTLTSWSSFTCSWQMDPRSSRQRVSIMSVLWFQHVEVVWLSVCMSWLQDVMYSLGPQGGKDDILDKLSNLFERGGGGTV